MTVAIVDPRTSDYDALLPAAQSANLRVCLLPTGNDALHLARRLNVDRWLINTCLPDMNGFDLAEMLRGTRRRACVFMIGDDYRLDEEVQTLTLGLSKYVCKPVDPLWFLPERRHLGIVAAAIDGPHGAVVGRLGSDDSSDLADDCVILPFNPTSHRPAA
jgi:DNA-binding response OmpR family regulator